MVHVGETEGLGVTVAQHGTALVGAFERPEEPPDHVPCRLGQHEFLGALAFHQQVEVRAEVDVCKASLHVKIEQHARHMDWTQKNHAMLHSEHEFRRYVLKGAQERPTEPRRADGDAELDRSEREPSSK